MITDQATAHQATYTLKEAAVYLRVSQRTVRRWVKRRLIRKSQATRKLILVGDDVEKFVEVTS